MERNWTEKPLAVEIYFGDPGSLRQGGNENANGMIWSDLPKSTNLPIYLQEELNAIVNKWNKVSRKSLNHYTPSKM